MLANQSLGSSKYMPEEFQSGIDELDPVLQGGYKVAYDKQIPVEVRNQAEGKTLAAQGALQMLRLRILVLTQEQPYSEVKIEITSETNLFFQFISQIDPITFKRIKKEQSLNIQFEQLVQMTIKLMNLADKQPNTHFAVLFITKNQAHMDFIENMEYKFIEVLSLQFKVADEAINKQSVSYRFGLMKNRINLVQSRLNDISIMIKLKNPSLLQSIQKATVPAASSNSQTSSNVKKLFGSANYNSTGKTYR